MLLHEQEHSNSFPDRKFMVLRVINNNVSKSFSRVNQLIQKNRRLKSNSTFINKESLIMCKYNSNLSVIWMVRHKKECMIFSPQVKFNMLLAGNQAYHVIWIRSFYVMILSVLPVIPVPTFLDSGQFWIQIIGSGFVDTSFFYCAVFGTVEISSSSTLKGSCSTIPYMDWLLICNEF